MRGLHHHTAVGPIKAQHPHMVLVRTVRQLLTRGSRHTRCGHAVAWQGRGVAAFHADTIRRLLVEQVTGRVRWRESMEWMATEGGVTRFVEIGSGKVLTGMAKRIAPDAESLALNTPEDLEAFAKSL